MTYILIVDDDEDIRVATSICLQAVGLKTLCAATVGEASTLLRQNDVSLIILDVFLQDHLGLSIVDQYHDHVPILVISGSDQNLLSLTDMVKELGAAGFLEKPFSCDVLTNRVSSLLKSADS